MLIKVVALKKPDIPEPSFLEIEHAIEHLKNHKAPRVDLIPSELIQAGGDQVRVYEEMHELIGLSGKKVLLPEQWKESIIVSIHKKGDKIDYYRTGF